MMVMVEKLEIGTSSAFQMCTNTFPPPEWDSATVRNRLMGRHPLRPKQLSKCLHKRRLLQVFFINSTLFHNYFTSISQVFHN